MRNRSIVTVVWCIGTLVSAVDFSSATILPDEGTGGKRLLTSEDYKRLEYFRGYAVSNDGKWLAYVVARDNDPAMRTTVTIRSVDDDQNWTIDGGLGAQFSDDCQWVVYDRRAATGML